MTDFKGAAAQHKQERYEALQADAKRTRAIGTPESRLYRRMAEVSRRQAYRFREMASACESDAADLLAEAERIENPDKQEAVEQ